MSDLITRKEELNTQLNRLEDRSRSLSIRRREELKRVWSKYFTPIGDDVIEFNHQGIEVKTSNSRWGFMQLWSRSEVISGNDYDEVTDVEVVVSRFDGSTKSSDGQWIVDRFDRISKYSQMVVDFKDDIMAELNSVEERYGKFQEQMYLLRKPVRQEFSSIDKKLRETEKEEMMKMLTGEGIKLVKPKDKEDNFFSNKPRIDLKYNWSMGNVKMLKVVKMSPSGKSCDLEIHTHYYGKNGVPALFEKRVRYENVQGFMNRYKNWIVK